MSDIENSLIPEDFEEEAEIVTLFDEEGEPHNFFVLDGIETDDGRFVALLPEEEDETESEDDESGDYFIFQVVTKDGEEELSEIEDEELLDNLDKIFQGRFSELYEELAAFEAEENDDK